MATSGWPRPAVMLPAAASEWSPERKRVVLLHEVVHMRRGLLQMAVETVRARLRRESEHAADDLVLSQGRASSAIYGLSGRGGAAWSA